MIQKYDANNFYKWKRFFYLFIASVRSWDQRTFQVLMFWTVLPYPGYFWIFQATDNWLILLKVVIVGFVAYQTL